MELFKQYWIPWLISNVAALLIVGAALWRPKLARLLFFLLFGWACWMNYTTSHNNPNAYLEYASLTPFTVYSNFINGWFKEHITIMVTLISIGQGLIALGMLLNGWWVRLACIGAIIFLMAIAPLGVGSGFPFSITASIAAWLIIKKDNLNYLWKFRKQ
ncbi:MAG TPA: hypothetical protein VK154_14275 [Chitinophagales bacterium]|nr:hypothetical protein [Chitinophagales bacterium]